MTGTLVQGGGRTFTARSQTRTRHERVTIPDRYGQPNKDTLGAVATVFLGHRESAKNLEEEQILRLDAGLSEGFRGSSRFVGCAT